MLLNLENLGRCFGEKWAFRSLSLRADAGQILAVVGPNGAGKTTLLKVLSTLLTPSEGRAEVNGYCVTRQAKKVRQSVAWVPATERGFFPRLTGLQNLRFHALLARASVRHVDLFVEQWGTFPLIRETLKTPYHLGSAGMRQALHLSRALLADPKVLLLDEPTRSLDKPSREMVWDWLKRIQSDRVVLVASHSTEEREALGAVPYSLERGA